MDEDTLHALKKPRCGDPEVEEEASRFKRFHSVIPWLKTGFTYYVILCNILVKTCLSQINRGPSLKRFRSGKAPAMHFPSLEQLTLATLTLRSG